MSTITISYPGGVKVDAHYKGHTVHTDQPAKSGGADTAPSPFDLFMVSIATCMGFYALRFCQERSIPTEDLRLSLDTIRDEEKKMVATVRVSLELPAVFPDKYRAAIRRAVEHCSVKAHLADPPAFELLVNGEAEKPATA